MNVHTIFVQLSISVCVIQISRRLVKVLASHCNSSNSSAPLCCPYHFAVVQFPSLLLRDVYLPSSPSPKEMRQSGMYIQYPAALLPTYIKNIYIYMCVCLCLSLSLSV